MVTCFNDVPNVRKPSSWNTLLLIKLHLPTGIHPDAHSWLSRVTADLVWRCNVGQWPACCCCAIACDDVRVWLACCCCAIACDDVRVWPACCCCAIACDDVRVRPACCCCATACDDVRVQPACCCCAIACDDVRVRIPPEVADWIYAAEIEFRVKVQNRLIMSLSALASGAKSPDYVFVHTRLWCEIA